MAVRSTSFDDTSSDELYVFSGSDLLTSHYDVADLDWQEVAERALIDQRRGLVITQVAVLEDLVDEFLLYLEDPEDVDGYRRGLSRMTIGPRLDMLEARLGEAGLLDREATGHLARLRAVVQRRHRLAHSTVEVRPTHPVVIKQIRGADLEVEWILIDRRSGEAERISMLQLRHDVEEAIGVFADLLGYAESFVERAAAPMHFAGGTYLGAPTP